MRCPICNEENAHDATTCQKCGFGLALATPEWPDLSSVTFPAKVPMPQRTDAVEPGADVKLSQPGPGPAWPERAIVDRAAVEEPVALPPVGDAQPAELAVESDDDLARLHIERGLEALRERMFDQARWEFEQARHLADDFDIVQLAEQRLDDLRDIIDREVQERLSSLRSSVPSTSPSASSPVQFAPTSGSDVNWTLALRASVVFGLVAGILAALSGGGCIGIFATPVLGLFAGVLAGERGSRLNVESCVAGALVGGAGGLGAAIGRSPLAIREATDLPSAVAMFLFFTIFYSFISIFAGFVGGWIAGGRSRK